MIFNLFARKPQRMPLEEQLRVLAECGITTRRGVTVDDFFLSRDREAYEKDAFYQVLLELGSEVFSEPWGPWFSDDIWHFDTECIEDNWAYVRIAERMRDLSKGELPITDIRDHVDLESRKAWLEFTIDGVRMHWDAKVQHDWVDESILGRLAQLLSHRGGERRFTYLSFGGQDCLLGASTPEQLAALRERTGRKFKWL